METVTFIISLVLAAGLWVLYRRVFGVVYFTIGAMFREFGVCFIIAFLIINAVGASFLDAISGVGSFLGFVLSWVLKIGLVVLVAFVVLGVIGAVLKKSGILKDEPKEGAEPGGEEATLTPDQDQDKAQDQDTAE